MFEAEFKPGFEERYPRITLDLEGELAEGNKTMSSMLFGMLLGIIGVYALLSFQFRSYSEPLIVMILIPLTLIGILNGHLLLDYPFTLPSMLGFIALAGIVVNDSLILIDFAKKRRAQGLECFEAVMDAGRVRIRPILLTTITTFLGISPLIFFASGQTAFLSPMAVSLGFGLVFATVLILVVVPCFYMVLDDLRTATFKRFSKQAIS